MPLSKGKPTQFNWLASYPKSGSTWVRCFLEYYGTGTLDINDMKVVVGDERAYYYQAVSAIPYHKLDLFQWAMIRPAALNMYLALSQRGKMICKTHQAYATIGEVPLFPPLLHGKSVYLVRNPIDIVPSFSRHTGMPLEEMLEQIGNESHAFEASAERERMVGYLSSWASHVTTWPNAPDTLVVRYEDLLECPEYWFKQILQQYGFEISKERISEAIEASSLKNLSDQEKDSGFSEAGRNDIFFGGTKEKLNPKQITKVIEAFETPMRKFNYLNEELKHGCNY